MLIRLKHNVGLIGLKPETLLAINIVASVYAEHGADCILTSVTDGKHGRGSFHYLGMACDFRIRHLTSNQLADIVSDIKASLTKEFDVVLEKTHIHLEYNPK